MSSPGLYTVELAQYNTAVCKNTHTRIPCQMRKNQTTFVRLAID